MPIDIQALYKYYLKHKISLWKLNFAPGIRFFYRFSLLRAFTCRAAVHPIAPNPET
jgi:hypothetical protein